MFADIGPGRFMGRLAFSVRSVAGLFHVRTIFSEVGHDPLFYEL